jgi:hypothetical protein
MDGLFIAVILAYLRPTGGSEQLGESRRGLERLKFDSGSGI